MGKTYFVSAIDTGVGKTEFTGHITKTLNETGKKASTFKLVQTGCTGISEDILRHREIMGIEPTEDDRMGNTCPYVFTYPASPHLAAEIDNSAIEPQIIKLMYKKYAQKFDITFLEGAGGLYVPITLNYNIIDFIQEENLPLLLVTSSILGSINHTLMSIELCVNRGIELAGLVYNEYPVDSEKIAVDSINVFRKFLESHNLNVPVIRFPQNGVNFKEEVLKLNI